MFASKASSVNFIKYFIISLSNSQDPRPPLQRLIYWAQLDHIGCSILNKTSLVMDVTIQERRPYGRIDLMCYYGSKTKMPRKWGHRPFERGEPCYLCPQGQTCSEKYEALCGEVDARGVATRRWNKYFWKAKDELGT